MIDFLALFHEFCKENKLSVQLSQDMPAGYETAYGTYDVTLRTLFLNLHLLENMPVYEAVFYLYHELRHSFQYAYPERFDSSVQESLPYVILYNGICYQLISNHWLECKLDGEEAFFVQAYLSLPYEMDANAFAYQKAKELCGDSSELQKLYASWTPQVCCRYEDLQKLFQRIRLSCKK